LLTKQVKVTSSIVQGDFSEKFVQGDVCLVRADLQNTEIFVVAHAKAHVQHNLGDRLVQGVVLCAQAKSDTA